MRLGPLVAACSLLLLGPTATAQDEPDPDAKIWVLAFGNVQLCATPDAYPTFCEKNAARPRGALRTETVARLKEIADAERPKILKALGDPKVVLPLWIVNGVALQVPRSAVETLREHEDIRFVYGWDFTQNSPEVLDIGKRQHGTLTSSLAVGDGTGGTITGVAPRARLMPIRASGGPYRAGLAMQYAIEQAGDVLSMSFSIPNLGHGRGLWRTMAEHASAAGLVLVSGSGNSLSAPQVAGICALMLSANPDLSPWRVKAILEETAKDIKPRGKDPETGAGLVNAFKAVEQAKKEVRVAETPR